MGKWSPRHKNSLWLELFLIFEELLFWLFTVNAALHKCISSKGCLTKFIPFPHLMKYSIEKKGEIWACLIPNLCWCSFRKSACNNSSTTCPHLDIRIIYLRKRKPISLRNHGYAIWKIILHTCTQLTTTWESPWKKQLFSYITKRHTCRGWCICLLTSPTFACWEPQQRCLICNMHGWV